MALLFNSQLKNLSFVCHLCVSLVLFSCEQVQAPIEASKDQAVFIDQDLVLKDFQSMETQDVSIDQQVQIDANLLDLEVADAQKSDLYFPIDMSIDMDSLSACLVYQSSIQLPFHLQSNAVKEASGLVMSVQNPGILWIHNDSGNASIIYGFNQQGLMVSQLILNINQDDWEDLGLATCPDQRGDCLWVSDSGDNLLNRDHIKLYAIREPILEEISGNSIKELHFQDHEEGREYWRFKYHYPDHIPVDVEALAIWRDGSRFALLQKIEEQASQVFQGVVDVNHRAETIALEKRTAFPSPGVPIPKGRLITSSALSTQGDRLLVRTYTGSYEYRFSQPYAFEELSTLQPIRIALGPFDEPQGEAIAYAIDQKGIWTLSENQQGEQPVHFIGCRE